MHGEVFDERETVLKNFADAGFETDAEIVRYLETYGFEEELVYNKVENLSGGEKNLLQLAKISHITQNGCLSGSVWSDNCHFLTSLHGEGHFLHDLPVECDTVIFHFQNHFFMILFRSFFTGGQRPYLSVLKRLPAHHPMILHWCAVQSEAV